MATKKTAAEQPVENVENLETEEFNDPGEEIVTVQLFKDNNMYKDDLYVAVNGERILIQRGVPVQIKRKFAEVIEHSQMQDRQTDALMQRMADAYVAKTEESTRA